MTLGVKAAESAATNFSHLVTMTDSIGVFEHALFDKPRPEHGYCLDDNARALIVAVREPAQTELTEALAHDYLNFVDEAITADGFGHNRKDRFGVWQDPPGLGDWWGRAIWGLGAAISEPQSNLMQQRGVEIFERAAAQRSQHVRANAFAAIGASDVLQAHAGFQPARDLLLDSLALLPQDPRPDWDWPEPALAYANGSLAEALIAAGQALEDEQLLTRGLQLLEFLLEWETDQGRFSVVGTSGAWPESARPQFDQQPIEVASIAGALERAISATGGSRWVEGIWMAWSWFEGKNDSSTVMYDSESGAGFDGLEQAGRNENRGAESTLAAMRTHQIFQEFAQ